MQETTSLTPYHQLLLIIFFLYFQAITPTHLTFSLKIVICLLSFSFYTSEHFESEFKIVMLKIFCEIIQMTFFGGNKLLPLRVRLLELGSNV